MNADNSGTVLENINQSGSKLSLDSFHADLDSQPVARLFEVDRLPTKEEIVDIARKPYEVIFIVTQDTFIYMAKGLKNDTKFDELRKQLGDNKINIVGHTHPLPESESREKEMFSVSLPSAGDLTSTATGVLRQYIFNTFGRVTFIPINNLGPKTEDEFGAKSITQSIINDAMKVAATEIRKQGIKDVIKILNLMGDHINRMLGAYFKFENWDDIKDPFS